MGTDNLTGSIDEPVEDGDSALHIACLYGHLPCVQVSHLLFLSATFIISVSVIIKCLLTYGYYFPKQLLLERGASLEAKDEDGAIPLHDACAGGRL